MADSTTQSDPTVGLLDTLEQQLTGGLSVIRTVEDSFATLSAHLAAVTANASDLQQQLDVANAQIASLKQQLAAQAPQSAPQPPTPPAPAGPITVIQPGQPIPDVIGAGMHVALAPGTHVRSTPITMDGDGQISGVNSPVLQAASPTLTTLIDFASTYDGSGLPTGSASVDGIILDVPNLPSNYTPAGRGIQGRGKGIVLRNVVCRNTMDFINLNGGVDGCSILGCRTERADSCGGYFWWFGGKNILVDGCVVLGSVHQHGGRGEATNVVIKNTQITNTGSGSQSCLWAMGGGNWTIGPNCTFTGGPVTVGPLNNADAKKSDVNDPNYTKNAGVSKVTVSGNTLNCTLNIDAGSSDVTVTGNTLNAPDGQPAIMVHCQSECDANGTPLYPWRTLSGIVIQHNTITSPGKYGQAIKIVGSKQSGSGKEWPIPPGKATGAITLSGNTYSAPNMVAKGYQTVNVYILADDASVLKSSVGNTWQIPTQGNHPMQVSQWTDNANLTAEQWNALPQVAGKDSFSATPGKAG